MRIRPTSSSIFTFQFLTNCADVNHGCTIMSGTWNHLRQRRQSTEVDLMSFIKKEPEYQGKIEAAGYCSYRFCAILTFFAISIICRFYYNPEQAPASRKICERLYLFHLESVQHDRCAMAGVYANVTMLLLFIGTKLMTI